jgi:hypothetical protein
MRDARRASYPFVLNPNTLPVTHPHSNIGKEEELFTHCIAWEVVSLAQYIEWITFSRIRLCTNDKVILNTECWSIDTIRCIAKL